LYLLRCGPLFLVGGRFGYCCHEASP
jgi:hypothetical protein